MFSMCAENVLRFSSIDCSSPISHKMSCISPISVPRSQGQGKPASAMHTSNPVVFSATVLPPIFGPVITMVRRSDSSSERSIGTGSSLKSGCHALTKDNPGCSFRVGKLPFHFETSLALAIPRSNCPRASMPSRISCPDSDIDSDTSVRILSTSSRSISSNRLS